MAALESKARWGGSAMGSRAGIWSVAVSLGLPLHLQAQSLIAQIGWRGANWSVVLALLGLMVGGIVALSVVYIRGKNRQKRDSEQFSLRAFREGVKRCGLADDEAAVLQKMVKRVPSLAPQTIFQSVSLFEKCVDEEVRLITTRGGANSDAAEGEILGALRKKLGFNWIPYEHPLVSTRNIGIGQVGALFSPGRREPLIQRATVIDNTELRLVMQYHVQQEDSCHIPLGSELRYAFSRQNDGFYAIALTVLAGDDAGTLVFSHTLELKRNQLRQYVRIEVNLPLKFRLLKTASPEKSDVKRGEVVEAKIADISGGGLSVLCPVSLRAGDILSLSFSIPGQTCSGITARVLRISLQEGKTRTLYRHHLQFTDIAIAQRERIVRFVFDRQRQINQWR